MFRLDIFIDPVCPWCLVGKTHLDSALSNHPDHPFTILWHPFQLNPTLPAEGVDSRPYMEAIFGGAAQLDAAQNKLRDVARGAGIDLNPDIPQRLPNTLNAHRLMHWAAIEGVQNAVVTGLFNAYWHLGEDIGDSTVLVNIAAGAGMDRAATLRLLQSDADRDDILARDDDARRKGVTSVPTYLIAQSYVVSGAQPPEVWTNIIAELRGKAAVQ
jgi:predicted DsbA family dithiol-disulfide isomerase